MRPLRTAAIGVALSVALGCRGAPRNAEPPLPILPRADPLPEQIARHVAAGLRLWRESCPVPGVAGLCATLTPATPLPCTEIDTPGLEMVARDYGLAMKAMGELSKAVSLWDAGAALDHDQGASPQDKARIDRKMIDQVAEAYFTLGEPVLERLLDQAPSYLRATDAIDDPVAALQRWVNDVGRATDQLERHYLRLREELEVDVADPWAAAAAARMSLIDRYHAETLLRAAVVVDGDQSGCAAITKLVAPLNQEAAVLLNRCREHSPANVAATKATCAELAVVGRP